MFANAFFIRLIFRDAFLEFAIAAFDGINLNDRFKCCIGQRQKNCFHDETVFVFLHFLVNFMRRLCKFKEDSAEILIFCD